MTQFTRPPAHVDRLIVHQFDPARPSPGGIDSCLRGMSRYQPEGVVVAVVGVDTGWGPAGRRLGQWEEHRNSRNQPLWFLPVVTLDPADQARKVPHALRLMAGVIRYRSSLPEADLVQVHRMDTAVALRLVLGSPQAYFIHTQENGLTGATSDSFWRFTGRAHHVLERFVVQRARSVVVFNEEYSAVVKKWNPRAVFSPTWFDPSLIAGGSTNRNPHNILWVGRFEVPKDPQLAVDAFAQLVDQDPDRPWTLDMIGPGTLLSTVRSRLLSLPKDVADRVRLLGRVAPDEVATRMADSGVFLMTSHPGYEGFARVLVESMASGLPAVVTRGSDTGGLVVDGQTGFACGREPRELADRLQKALTLDPGQVRKSVATLNAPTLVRRLFALDQATARQGAMS